MASIKELLKSCSNASKKKIVIIGNGVAGITCARHIRKKSSHEITVISAETDHHFSRTALMYIYMGHMRYQDTKPYEDSFWAKNKINLLNRFVNQIDTDHKVLHFSNGETISYDILVIASGSKTNKFGWPGQESKGVQGLFNFQDLELMEQNTKNISHAVIVGGGLIGVEMAEMLRSRKIGVTFLVREKQFWGSVLPKEEAQLIETHIKEHHIDLQLGEELQEIIADENGVVQSIVTKSGKKIVCQFVGLTVGVSPNVEFIKNSHINIDRGVLVNEYFETNIDCVYAIGDCAQFTNPVEGRRSIEQVWYTGRMQGETLAHSICIDKTSYKPGHWFNSAKFFDIEYQTYGNVPSSIEAPLRSFYWQHPTEKICFRAVYNAKTEVLVGINTFGIRMRHVIFDQWLTENKTIDFVIQHLKEANFDPEFFKKYESQIANAYQHSKTLKA